MVKRSIAIALVGVAAAAALVARRGTTRRAPPPTAPPERSAAPAPRGPEAAELLAPTEADYRQTLASDPENLPALLGLGRVLRARSPLQSEEVLDAALRIDSEEPAVWMELAVTRAHMLHYDEALEDAQAVIDLDPGGSLAGDARALIAFLRANPRSAP